MRLRRESRVGFGAVLALLCARPFSAPAAAQPDPFSGDTVLALVDGEPITVQEVRAGAADKFQELERSYRESLRALVEGSLAEVIQRRLLAVEARALGTSPDQLLAGIAPAPVTDADVDAFYEQNKERIPRPKEEVAPQIRQYLAQQDQQTAREKYLEALAARHRVEMKLEPVRVEVAAIGPSRGPESAPVTIVEFSDFQCPFCSRLNPTLEQVRAKYGDKVRIVFRQFPLSFHQQAQKAAEASLCAAAQGKFWELHDAMFANQQALAVEQLKAKAAELGLNAESFDGCLDAGAKAADVQADLEAGTAAGVSGTPALFVNGRFISGAVPFEQIAAVIDDELRRRGVSGSN